MAKYLQIEIDLKQACAHCDLAFPKSYLSWHASRAIKKGGRAQLTCRKCGCWTPVIFKVKSSDHPITRSTDVPIAQEANG